MGVEIGDNMLNLSHGLDYGAYATHHTKSDVLTVLSSECRCHTVATYPSREAQS